MGNRLAGGEQFEMRDVGVPIRREILRLPINFDLGTVAVAQAHVERLVTVVGALRTGRQQAVFEFLAIGGNDFHPAGFVQRQRQRMTATRSS